MGVSHLVLRFSSQVTRFYFGVKVLFLQAGFWLSIEVPVLGVCVPKLGWVSIPGGEFSLQGPGFMITVEL